MADDKPANTEPSTSTATPSTEGAAAGAETAPEQTRGPDLAAQVQAAEARAAKASADADAAKRSVVQLVTELQTLAAQQARSAEVPRGDKLRELLDTDPEKALDAVLEERTRPIREEQQQLQVQQLDAIATLQHRLAEERVLAKGGHEAREWAKYKAEVDQFMRDVPVDVRAKDGAWERAFNLVRMDHLDEIMAERSSAAVETEKRSRLEGASGPRSARASTPTLNDLEKRMAAEFGMTEAEYLKEKLAIEGDRGGEAA